MKKRNGSPGSPAEAPPPDAAAAPGPPPPSGPAGEMMPLTPLPAELQPPAPSPPADGPPPGLFPTVVAGNGAEGAAPMTPMVVPDSPPGVAVPPAGAIMVGAGGFRGADPAELEQRLRRLEDALAQLQDLQGMETRVAERVAGRLIHDPPPTPAEAHAAVLLDFGKRLLRAPVDAARHLASGPAGAGSPRAPRLRLLLEAVAEARAIVRMFLDPRYRLSWTGRVVPLTLTALVVTSWWWVPGTSIPLFGTVLDKAIDLVLAFVLFKVLGYEARRYRETAPDLPPSLRL